ncbi:hypothetical protein F5Y15DRAFT_309925 [Xylariaceae sp. FL0016]|nr:hypothetical protein F5Y15DRAFT_309925 [Xylariaceae sp. FL0016]
MRKLALKDSPSAAVNLEQPFTSEYRTMWFTFPRQPGFFVGEGLEAHGENVSLQFLNSVERSWVFLYERLEAPTRERARYTEDDMEGLAKRLGHIAIKREDLKVRDVYPLMHHGGMTNLEEGILDHWYWGRIVLLGDAAHKVTPNIGQGLNTAIQDVVALVNELHGLVKPSDAKYYEDEKESTEPSLEQITGAFERYQTYRKAEFAEDFRASALQTRLSAWPDMKSWLLDYWIMWLMPAWLEALMVTWKVCTRICRGLVLNFVHGDEPFKGSWPWAHAIPSIKPPK